MSATDVLQLERTWLSNRRLVTCWRQQSRPILQQTRHRLHSELRRSLYRSCVHLKGHGGVKGALRRITRQQGSHRYVARFDVARYYEDRAVSPDNYCLSFLTVSRQIWYST